MQLAFDAFFSVDVKPNENRLFVLSAKDDFELYSKMGTFENENISKVLEEAFEIADCESCVEVSVNITENPNQYIFKIIEYQDVFLITQEGDKFKVIRYQPQEED